MKKIKILMLLGIVLVLMAACSGSKDDRVTSTGYSNTASGVSVNIPGVPTNPEQPSVQRNGITTLRFKDTLSIEYLKKLSGKRVTINGYMASSSPADGSFIFLMNLPYQNCPYCVPNTTELANTLEVYPKEGEVFEWMPEALKITGRLEVATDGEPWTDPYGYEFYVKVVDAEYESAKDGVDPEWQAIASSGVINDLYSLYDWTYFMCSWPDYYTNNHTDAEGNTVYGYYLFPGDVEGYVEYYFPALTNPDEWMLGLRTTLSGFNNGAAQTVLENAEKAFALAKKAIAAMENGEYTKTTEYIEMFGREDDKYTLNDSEAFIAEFDGLYASFMEWINSFEL